MGRNGSHGARSTKTRELRKPARLFEDNICEASSAEVREQRRPLSRENLEKFYDSFMSSSDTSMSTPFRLRHLELAVDRVSCNKEKVARWAGGLDKSSHLMVCEVGNLVVARAAFLDLSISPVTARKILFGDGDNYFHPARMALANAVKQLSEEIPPLLQPSTPPKYSIPFYVI